MSTTSADRLDRVVNNVVLLVGTVDTLPDHYDGAGISDDGLKVVSEHGGQVHVRFRLRTPKGYSPEGADPYDYHWCELAGKNARWAIDSLAEGDLVVVQGRLSYDRWPGEADGAERIRALVRGRANYVASFGEFEETSVEEGMG